VERIFARGTHLIAVQTSILALVISKI